MKESIVSNKGSIAESSSSGPGADLRKHSCGTTSEGATNNKSRNPIVNRYLSSLSNVQLLTQDTQPPMTKITNILHVANSASHKAQNVHSMKAN